MKITTAIFLFLCVITSLSARPPVQHRRFSRIRQSSSDEWKRGNFGLLEGLPVRRIMFYGNTNTADTVLRRAFRIKEGNIFSRKGLERSLKHLNRLGLFERITEEDISWKKGDDIFTSDLVDFVVSVKEKRRK